jgi:hypothetical protein
VASGGVYSIKTHSGAYVRIDCMLFGQEMAAEITQLVMVSKTLQICGVVVDFKVNHMV